MIRRVSLRSSSSRGDLSLAAIKAAAISLLSSCEIAIFSPGEPGGPEVVTIIQKT